MDEEKEVYIILEKRQDGSYVIERCGLPYHVPECFDEWEAVNAQWEADDHADV